MSNAKREETNWVVVHGSQEGMRPVSVRDCYRDRDPYGEYVYFAASDPQAVTETGISVTDYRYLAEVRASFEEDLVETGLSDIEWCREDLAEQGDAFLSEIWPSWLAVSLGEIADAIFPPGQDFVMARSVLGVGDDHAAWVEITRVEADLPAEMALTFCQVHEDRLLEAKAVLKDPDVAVEQLASLWRMLVDRFRDLPYERLSGAERIEPEMDDEGDFDLGALGDLSDLPDED